MKICIAGWYFRPKFLDKMYRARIAGFDAFMIKHREGDSRGVPSQLYPNYGLEFGAYRQYVENHWDKQSDVLFLHDDTEISDAVSTLGAIESLNERGVDHAYIFPDETHEYVNGGCHGRGMWIRGSILKQIATNFPADMHNDGINIGTIAQKGILEFHERIMECSKNTGVIAIVPQIVFGHRGRIHEEMFVYRKHALVPGDLVNVSE